MPSNIPDDIPTLAQIEKEIQEREYYEFFKAAWLILEPTTPLQDNWHIKYLCDTLQLEIERIARGEKKTLDILINIPPRTLKSSIVTITLNAWAWARWPHLKFIASSYASTLATEHATKARRLIDSEWYKSNWGHKFKLTDDQNTKEMFENNKSGFRKSVGVGSALTGSGSDILIIDDPLNPEEAHSEADRLTCTRWFKETAYSRLNNQEIGLRIVVMQRLHQSDTTGYILENQKHLWRHICLPVSTEFEVKPPELVAYYKNGLLFPARFNAAVIADAKTILGAYGYAGQMGQSPTPLGGGIIHCDWFVRYKVLPEKILRRIWSWDTAVKTAEKNDWSVGQLWAEGVYGYYLERLIRAKMEYPDLLQRVKTEYTLSPSSAILIEDKSSGQQLLQSLKKETKLPIIAIEADKDKVARANFVTPTIQAGRVYIPEDAEWMAAFLSEVSMFNMGTYDDQVDALTQVLKYFTEHGRPVSSWSGTPIITGNPEWA